VRRLAEGLVSYLPIAFVLGLALLFFGRHHLYEWSNAKVVGADHLLQLKSAYLNTKFMGVRLVVFFGIWMFFTYKMRKNSLAQDSTGDTKFTLSNIRLSAIFIPLFAISFTLMSFDLIMSLEPHWYSTIFGVYCFAGMFVTGNALLAVLLIYGRRQGTFSDKVVNDNHMHDVGKLMLAFTVFWAYIMFSQLMLQWYANLPEETSYYIRRFHGGWWKYSILLFLVRFVIPFFGLLPREVKRRQNYLMGMGLLILAAQWMDCYYLVMPVFSPAGPQLGWIEIGTFLGFFGAFGISVGRFFEKVPAVAARDPRLVECLAHTQ
jgi:hypothetical protein